MNQPGCFGVPSVFSFASAVCRKCAAHDACQTQAHAALLSAPEGIANRLLAQHRDYCRSKGATEPSEAGIETSRPHPKVESKLAIRFALTDAQNATLEGLSKKSSDYLKKLMVRGLDKAILAAAEGGENAFTKDRHRPYHLALEKLLAGSLTKRELRAAYCDELGWSEPAAYSQVSMVWQIFPAMGLAHAQGCALVARPRAHCENTFIRFKKG